MDLNRGIRAQAGLNKASCYKALIAKKVVNSKNKVFNSKNKI